VSWDRFQREALAELGLAAYALAEASALIEAQAKDDAPTPLLLALLRAAAADMNHADALALCREFLTENPNPSSSARRKLWPKLRHLRIRTS